MINRKPRPTGFTLVEALSTLCIFSFFIAILFMTIAWGFRAFSLAVARSDVTTEARRLALFLERELRSSSYFSITFVPRTKAGNRRDGLCFVSRNDWSKAQAFDSVQGAPAWNRYFIYYATEKEPFGEFVRMVVHPPTAEIGAFPYQAFAASPLSFMVDAPSSVAQPYVESSRSLASSVLSFEVRPRAANQEVDLKLLLRQNGVMARRASGEREGGTFEVQYRVQPQNTL